MPHSRLYILNLIACALLGALLLAGAAQSAFAEASTAGAAADAAATEEIPLLPDDTVVLPAEEPVEQKKGGFPQLDTTTYPSQLFWLFVSFLLLYTLMSRIALPRITEVLELRQTQREGNLNRAEQLQEDAEKVKATVDAALAKAHAEAQEALSANEQQRARKVAEENARFLEHARNRIAAAEQNIAKAKEDALQSLSDISAEIAAEITQKIAAVPVTKAEAKKVVATLMKEAA